VQGRHQAGVTIGSDINHGKAILKTGIDHDDNDKPPQTLTRAAAANQCGGASLRSLCRQASRRAVSGHDMTAATRWFD
jgi:hypothetical protein